MSSYDNTQLSNALEFNPNNIVFQEPQLNKITLGDGKTKIIYYRIPVGVKNADGSLGELVFSTERLFSFGVQENKNMDSDKIDGYSMALCMWNRDGATTEQKQWIEGFTAAIEKCKEHVLEVKEDIEKYDLEESDLKKFNPLYYKREKGKIIEGRGPTLYPKLITSRKESPPKILSPFYDQDSGDSLCPRSLIGKYCHVTAAVKIESIYVGARISPQVKLYEAEVKLAQNKTRRLLKRDTTVRAITQDNILDDDDDDGSINGDDTVDDNVEEEVVEEPVKKKVVRRVVKRVKKVVES
jgi:hypothetical protein